MNKVSSNDKLIHLRSKVDSIDEQISRLLVKRFFIVRLIGKLKKISGLPLYDKKRETEIFNRLETVIPASRRQQSIKEVFKKILVVSQKIQQS